MLLARELQGTDDQSVEVYVHFGSAFGEYVSARYSEETECKACTVRVVEVYNTRTSMNDSPSEAMPPQVDIGVGIGATPRSGEIVDRHATLLTLWGSCKKIESVAVASRHVVMLIYRYRRTLPPAWRSPTGVRM